MKTLLHEAWRKIFKEGAQAQVTKAFKICDMYNAIDRYEDSEIRFQGIENYEIGASSSEESDEEDDDSDDYEQYGSDGSTSEMDDGEADSKSGGDSEQESGR